MSERTTFLRGALFGLICGLLIGGMAAPARALECPDGSWHDKAEHCELPTTYQCVTGEWHDDPAHCPFSEERPEPKPADMQPEPKE